MAAPLLQRGSLRLSLCLVFSRIGFGFCMHARNAVGRAIVYTRSRKVNSSRRQCCILWRMRRKGLWFLETNLIFHLRGFSPLAAAFVGAVGCHTAHSPYPMLQFMIQKWDSNLPPKFVPFDPSRFEVIATFSNAHTCE